VARSFGAILWLLAPLLSGPLLVKKYEWIAPD